MSGTPRVGPLSPYALDPAHTAGRRVPEPAAPTRDDYQRDRDRIVHSSAFRRLVYKTQVFLNHEGDLYRTRLTHSLEVAQLARAMARALGLSEDLVEALALAHDLGHTPFGHAGQDALAACMAGHGGFEHNLQSLRVVDQLEQRYPGWDGLNLCLETREGILKRCSPERAAAMEAAEPGGVARRFIHGWQPSLEAQVVNLADEIAYNAHDVDDGVRSGLLTLAQVEELPLLAEHGRAVEGDHPGIKARAPKRYLAEIIRRSLSHQVIDVVEESRRRLAAAAPASAHAARLGEPLIAFSPAMRQHSKALKRFLLAALYRHPQVMATTGLAQRIVGDLFELYVAKPEWMATAAPGGNALRQLPHSLQREVADYIAGMTDRFATQAHARLTGQKLLPMADLPLHRLPADAMTGA